MKVERTGAGLEARLEIRGFGRFAAAAFMCVWLAGWGFFEVFVLWFLGKGAWSLITGAPYGNTERPVEFGVAMTVGLFLLVWTVLWTLGGVAAIRELLRLLFGRDVIGAGNEGLEIKQRYGFFRSTKRWARDEIRRFYRTGHRGPLWVETTRGKKVVTKLGTPEERAELERALNEEFRIEARPASEGALPNGWCEVLSLERDSVLVKDPAVRRKHARTAWVLCGVLSSIPLYILIWGRARPDLLGAVLFFVMLASAAASAAVWLSYGRNEWRLEKGRVVLQRRFGGNRTERFEGVALEFVEDNSGEDGPGYSLTAVAPGAPAWTRAQSAGKQRRIIHTQNEDPTEPRDLGLWLSQQCQIPFTDLTTAHAKVIELEALKQQLAGSGRPGRAALNIIERVAPSPAEPREKTGS